MKILVIRKSSLGDIIHTIPAVRALGRSVPGSEIHWLVSRAGAAIVERISEVREIQILQRGTLARLRRQHYDLVLDFQGLMKTALIAYLSGSRMRIGFAGGFARESLCHLFYTRSIAPTGTHVIQKNLSLAAAAGAHVPDGRFDFGELLTAEDRSRVSDRLSAMEIGGRFLLLNPGAGWRNKQWAPRKFGELARRLSSDVPVLVSYAPGERWLAQAVVEASGGEARLAFPTTLMELGALAERSALLVSGDTGPMHLACAVGARVLGLFAPTSPYRNGPWRESDRWVLASTRCDFCWKRRCPWENCIDRIEVDEVESVAREMLAQGGLSA